MAIKVNYPKLRLSMDKWWFFPNSGSQYFQGNICLKMMIYDQVKRWWRGRTVRNICDYLRYCAQIPFTCIRRRWEWRDTGGVTPLKYPLKYFQKQKDSLLCIQSRNRHFQFLYRSPLILCLISKQPWNLAIQLDTIYNQVFVFWI